MHIIDLLKEGRQMLSLDQSGFKVGQIKTHGWSLSGQPCLSPS